MNAKNGRGSEVVAHHRGCDEHLLAVRELHERLQEPDADCAALLHVDGPLAPHGCTAHWIGNESTLLVYAEESCGGDSCSGNTWVVNSHTCGALGLAQETGTFEASPDGRFLFVDHPIEGTEMTAVGPVVDFEIHRVAIPSLEETAFAPCMSAKLSPGGKWILCRNRQADVLKVPLAGGTPVVVAAVGIETARFIPYAVIYPDAVAFPSQARLIYTVDDAASDEGPVEHSVAWSE